MSISKHHGSCFCGDVQFEVELDLSKGSKCNCTVCTKTGATGTNVKPAAFTLLSEESKLASFTRNPEFGRRFFCARCHIFCFGKGHLEVLGGDFVSINLNCIDDFDVSKTELIHWDGRHDNWQAGPRPTPWPVAPATSAQ
ncbi:MAG TPA: GFA family protein [Kofleriaceae bacterium]|nr:GFA family protein [Kofleriaceae bacterium]